MSWLNGPLYSCITGRSELNVAADRRALMAKTRNIGEEPEYESEGSFDAGACEIHGGRERDYDRR